MPIDYKFDQDTKIIQIHLSEKIQESEISVFLPEVDRLIHEYGNLKVLEVFENFRLPSFATFRQLIKFDYEHIQNTSHVAVVTDHAWIRRGATFAKKMIGIDVKLYGSDEKEVALAWLKSVE